MYTVLEAERVISCRKWKVGQVARIGFVLVLVELEKSAMVGLGDDVLV